MADGVNAVLYLLERDWGNAGLSGISVFPLIGDYFGKGGKGAKYALKAADLTKLNRNKKVIKVLDNLDVFIKARKADLGEARRLLRESWENLMDGGRYAERYVTPDGLVYWGRTSDDFRVNINLMDEAGDTLQETWRARERISDVGELTGCAIKSGLNSKLLDELVNSGVKYNSEDIVAITKTVDGKLVWLENGTNTAGLNHIISEHADDFLNKGITQEQIPDYIMNALENGKIVGYQGRGTGRPIYEFTYNGEIHKVLLQ